MRFFLILLLSMSVVCLSAANGRAGLIRDAEIEQTVRNLASPLFESAGLTPESVRIFLVQNDSINAFVAGGSNIFLHTGLLLNMESPEMLAGVIAHETGHIAGGHLARGAEQLQRASLGAVISYVLGAAAVAAGAGDVGAAIISGGGNTVERGLLSFSRTNENSADQAALSYLTANHISASGMLDTFQLLRRQEKLHYGQLDPYAITHPLSKERINNVRDFLSRSELAEVQMSQATQDMHARMVGKLEGFLLDPVQVLQRYPTNDTSLKARYARAVAHYRRTNLTQALSEMDALLAEHPNDAFFHEAKGQFLFENNRIPAAEKEYGKALELAPDQPLIRTGYAQTLIASNDTAKQQKAAENLEISAKQDDSYGLTWHLLAGAYTKLGKTGLKHLALAEKSALEDDFEITRAQSKLAMEHLDRQDPSYIRASDLNNLAIREIAKKEDEEGRIFR